MSLHKCSDIEFGGEGQRSDFNQILAKSNFSEQIKDLILTLLVRWCISYWYMYYEHLYLKTEWLVKNTLKVFLNLYKTGKFDLNTCINIVVKQKLSKWKFPMFLGHQICRTCSVWWWLAHPLWLLGVTRPRSSSWRSSTRRSSERSSTFFICIQNFFW